MGADDIQVTDHLFSHPWRTLAVHDEIVNVFLQSIGSRLDVSQLHVVLLQASKGLWEGEEMNWSVRTKTDNG